jgi:type VI secretion system secreted protein VgrG
MTQRKVDWLFGNSLFRKSAPRMPRRTRHAQPLTVQIEFLEERTLLSVILGAASSFAVMGGSAVTNTGPSAVIGNVRVSPGGAVSGFAAGDVTDAAIHVNDGIAVQAHSDLATAYNVLAGEAVTTVLTGQNLGGLTLAPGVYLFSSSAQLTGKLTLDAGGDPNAELIFQIGSTLTTATSSSVVMINGGNPSNVYWQIGSSATLGTGTAFKGNILALTSITVTTGASISDGSALAINGGVTLDDNAIMISSPSIHRVWRTRRPPKTSRRHRDW